MSETGVFGVYFALFDPKMINIDDSASIVLPVGRWAVVRYIVARFLFTFMFLIYTTLMNA